MAGTRRGFSRERYTLMKFGIATVSTVCFAASWLGFAANNEHAGGAPPNSVPNPGPTPTSARFPSTPFADRRDAASTPSGVGDSTPTPRPRRSRGS